MEEVVQKETENTAPPARVDKVRAKPATRSIPEPKLKRRFPPIQFQSSEPSEFEQLIPGLMVYSQELYTWYAQHEPIRLLGIQAAQAQKAANDEEEDLILLLMAA